MPLIYVPPPRLNEAEWQSSTDPDRMLRFLCYHWRQGLPRWLELAKTSNRKLRLFGCACGRLNRKSEIRAIDLAERYADGLATRAELKAARSDQGEFWTLGPPVLFPFAYDAAYHAATHLPSRMVLPLLRDIFGNPFHPVTLDTARQTRTVLQLAQTIYDSRTFDRMPDLADALETAGCANREVLEHCRGGGEHVKGCWVVDLVLGKE